MKNLLSKTGSLVVGSLCVAGALPASATSLYNNLDNGASTANQFNGTVTLGTAGTEIADQVVLDQNNSGSLYDLNSLTLALFGSFSGTEQVKVSFYANNGSLWNPADPNSAAPNSTLWSSDWFSLNSTDFTANQALLTYSKAGGDFNNLGLLPQSFTIGLQFQGDATPDQVGMWSFTPIATNPGKDYTDYWSRPSATGDWALNPGSPSVDFGTKIDGTAQVPEPSLMALLGLGGLGLMALAKRSRRQE